MVQYTAMQFIFWLSLVTIPNYTPRDIKLYTPL